MRSRSSIISLLGEVLAVPLWDNNGLLVYDVDFDDYLRGRLDLDIGGSYSKYGYKNLGRPFDELTEYRSNSFKVDFGVEEVDFTDDFDVDVDLAVDWVEEVDLTEDFELDLVEDVDLTEDFELDLVDVTILLVFVLDVVVVIVLVPGGCRKSTRS